MMQQATVSTLAFLTSDASGSWGLHIKGRVVLVSVARVLDTGSHHSERATSNCNWCGNLGMAVVRQGSQSTMLQCGMIWPCTC